MRVTIIALALGSMLGLSTSLSMAKERIYILAGQSNMMGRGKTSELNPSYKSTPANVTFYYQGRPRKLAHYAFFGPEVTFAHEVARAFPHDQHILIKSAATGSSIKQWQPDQPLYRSLIRQLGLALPNDTNRVDAIIWMQGEQDAKKIADAQLYQVRFNQFIQALRQSLKAPNSLVVMGRVNPQDPGFKMVELVQSSQAQLARTVPNTVLVDTQGLGTAFDLVHYNAQGQMELGRRLAQAYILRRR